MVFQQVSSKTIIFQVLEVGVMIVPLRDVHSHCANHSNSQQSHNKRDILDLQLFLCNDPFTNGVGRDNVHRIFCFCTWIWNN